MYSWGGDDTKNWKNPSAYDYGSARKPYLDDIAKKAADEGPRSYSSKKKPNLELVLPYTEDQKGNKTPKDISSQSEDVVLLAIDGTGSMQKWPFEIFDRLPLLYQTLSKYRPNVEFSFAVIGDANNGELEQWPLQVSNFGKELDLEKYLKALHAEGKGGGGVRETYELWGHYIDTHCKVEKAKDPTIIIMGDEKFYDQIQPGAVERCIGEKIQAPINSLEMWKSLGQKYDIYFLRKSYAGHDEEVKNLWSSAIGAQKIYDLPDATRVVDVAMGIVARKWGNFGDFKVNLSARQDEEVAKSVMTSLKAPSVYAKGSMKSTVVGKSASGKSKAAVSKKLTED